MTFFDFHNMPWDQNNTSVFLTETSDRTFLSPPQEVFQFVFTLTTAHG